LSGLSLEQAGRTLLADCWPGPFEPDYYSSPALLMDHHKWIYETLEWAVGVLRLGKWRLFDRFGNPVPPGQITLVSFKHDDETLSLMRLVLAQAQMPTSQELQPDPGAARHEGTTTPAPLDLKRLAVIEVILEEWERRWTKVPPDPLSAKKTASELQPCVKKRDYDVSLNYIQKIAEAKILEPLRRKPGGNHKIRETEIAKAKRLLGELKALPAVRKLELIKPSFDL
jgi:hypothetical protein